MSVYFHGNFGLHRERMSKILKLGLENPKISEEELAKPFGYRKPFIQRYRSWLHKTGLTKIKLPIRLTLLGEVVFKHDPKLDSIVTQWFMHWELTQDEERAEAWHFFANDFLPKNLTFTRDDLQMGLMMKLRSHSEQHFGPESKLNKVIVRKLIDCYTNNEALGSLDIIKVDGDNFIYNKDLKTLGPWGNAEQLGKTYEHG